MRALHRLLALAAASAAAITMSAAGPLTAAGASPARPAAAGAAAVAAGAATAPGRTHRPIVLANNVSFDGYDAVTSSNGTTYLGWIADHGGANRTVYLCVLPRGAVQCAGGIQSTPSLGDSSAEGLHLVIAPGGQVTLVWFHDTTQSVGHDEGGEVATATVSHGTLSAASDQAPAPSFGSLQDAVIGPDGGIWAVTAESAGAGLQVVPDLGTPVKVSIPYFIGSAQLAFSGSKAVLVIQQAGQIGQPVAYSASTTHSWPKFRNVPRTWTSDANLGLARTGSGIRLLATIDNASYWPVVSRWTGSSFSRRQPTGDHNPCSPSSHAPESDASGRMVDVSMECGDVAVANLTDTLHAAVMRFANGGTFAGGIPQITTSPRGRGWVMWSIESTTNDKLFAAPVLLPGRLRTVSHSSHGDRVRLTGPASCLPPVTVHLKVSGSPATHWRVVSRTLRLDGAAHSATLNGGSLVAGRHYTLTGRVVFADGGARRTVTATLTFRTCPNP